MVDHVATTCPAPRVLRAYSTGSLPLDEFELVERHIADCSHCVRVLDESDASDEPLVATLREHDLWRCEEEGFRQLRKRIEEANPADMSPLAQSSVHAAPHEVLQAATVLGNYQLAECVGHGAMGVVYRAQHVKLKRWVAVKILTSSRQGAAAALKRFEQEMQILGQLDEHENIVRARDAGQSGDHHFLVMDYVDGVDVSRLLSQVGPLEVPDACEIIRQAASALAHAHQHGLVHRDVKPNNLMVTREGCVKLLDLGLASYHDAPTEEVGIAGTADYLAPEAWQSNAVGPAVDIYGLGCTLFKLLIGYAPFARGEASNEAKQRRHATEQPPAVDAIRRDVPSRLAQMIATMLAKDPQQRIESAAEVARLVAPMALAEDLPGVVANAMATHTETDRLTSELTTPLAKSPPARQEKGQRLTRRMWAVGAAAAGAGAWWGWQTQRVDYELLWALAPQEVHWRYQSRRGLLQVQASQLALITKSPAAAGPTTLGSYVIPRGRQTRAGFFYGHRIEQKQGWTIRRFYTIGLSLEESTGPCIDLIEHRFTRSPEESLFEQEQLLASAPFAASDAARPGGPLIVSLRGGQLRAATFKGRRLEEIEAAAASRESEESSSASAGIFLTEGAATFREASTPSNSA